MTTHTIAVLPGDGIGQEVTPEAVRVLQAVARRARVSLQFEQALCGGAAIDATGAGDAFAAALAVMLAEGRALSDAGPVASAAAALATTKIGAQASLPRRDAVLALLAQTAAPHQREAARERGGESHRWA